MTDLLEQVAGTEGAAGGGPEVPASFVLTDPGALTPKNRELRTRGILKRRSAPIMGYVGLNGQGKTYCMVRDTLLSLALGRRVLSTVTLLDPHTGNPHPLFEPLRSWQQLLDWRNGDVLFDEITGIMDSRDSGMPKHVRQYLPQMRRANAPIRWTGIDWDNSDRRMRQLTWAVVKSKGVLADHKKVRQDGASDAVTMWAPNRAFLFTTYDASTLTQSEDGQRMEQDPEKKRRVRVLNRELVWGPGSLAFACYNTLDAVLSVDNSCPICGKKRGPEPVCRGH